MYKRVLLKLSGEALSSKDHAFDPQVLRKLAQEIKEVHDTGVELAIVVGGGNFIRGKVCEEMGLERTQADNMGMLATVINALAVQNALEQIVNAHYEEKMKNEGVDRILKYGIACYKKRCKVQLIGDEEGRL